MHLADLPGVPGLHISLQGMAMGAVNVKLHLGLAAAAQGCPLSFHTFTSSVYSGFWTLFCLNNECMPAIS